MDDLSCTDFFCGMGGSSTGLVEAGYTVRLAANHWDRAIETHAANHPSTEHLCANLQAVDLRRLPRTRFLWASPICTELSPAGGRARRTRQMDLFEAATGGHAPAAGFERTRTTFWEVIRATELFRYDAVMVENVVEAADWELFPVWLEGMKVLGYTPSFVSVSAAHVGGPGNPHAPQWRDRMYIVLTGRGLPVPDLEPRPAAWCTRCDKTVRAVQWWKPKRRHAAWRIGKYKSQYLYVCSACGTVVEPYVAPAAAAIDWTDTGQRIGDRARPLATKTMRRIQTGLDLYGASLAQNEGSFLMAVNHDSARHALPGDGPLPTRTAKRGQALITVLRRHGTTYPADAAPLATVTGAGRHHGLVTPPGAFIGRNHGGYARPDDPRMVQPTNTVPMPPARAHAADWLVIPYRQGSHPHPAHAEPVTTMAGKPAHSIITNPDAPTIEDCRFRMLTPREAANAQRFPGDYQIHGNKTEQQLQAGNAVAVNVAHWIGSRLAAALDGRKEEAA